MLPLLFEFSSLIKKCITLLAPGTAKSTFCRLLGFWQTELRQSRENSPCGVWTNTSKVGQIVVVCLKELSETPADQMYGGLLGSVPTGSAWPGRSCGKCSRSPCVTERPSFPAFLSLLPDVGVLIIPLAGYRAMEGCLASECSSLKEYACLALVGFFPDARINQFLNCLNKILLRELSQWHQGFRYYEMSKWRSVPGWSQTMTQTELSH